LFYAQIFPENSNNSSNMTADTPRLEQDLLFDKANDLFYQRKFKEAYDLFLQSYELGNKDASLNLASMLTGFFPGVDRDFKKSMSYYRIAMQGNTLKTVFEDALVHSSWGHNPVMNEFGFKLLDELVPYLKPQYLNMIFMASLSLMNGDETFPKSAERAYRLMQFAGDHGDLCACFMAGIMVLNGNGCAKEPQKALEIIHKAADYGYEMAQNFLKAHEEKIKSGNDTGFGFTAFTIRITPAKDEENSKDSEETNSPKS